MIVEISGEVGWFLCFVDCQLADGTNLVSILSVDILGGSSGAPSEAGYLKDGALKDEFEDLI